ncbi:glycosyltransferase family A protein [Mesotoga infera]|nr:glycosyltransferase family A protein [Mesotoga infera]
MNQKDMSIIQRTNINTDALLINQTDSNSELEVTNNGNVVRLINTTEKGLSRSRNKAIMSAHGEICLLCDDDEILVDNYEAIITNAFDSIREADIIAFKIARKGKKYWNRIKSVNRFSSLRISSVQIAFKRDSIVRKGVKFNEQFGAGSNYPFGEENLFLIECLKNGLKIFFFPSEIGTVKQESSSWFKGYDECYFYHRGIVTAVCLGRITAVCYGVYFMLSKRRKFENSIGLTKGLLCLMRGVFDSRRISKGMLK